MKAVILQSHQNLVLQDALKPTCSKDEILVKVKVCNICKTDLKCFTYGQRDLIYPRVLGHEISGIVDSVGSNITDYQVGDIVYIYPGIACGVCQYCKQGLDNLCDNIKIMGFNYDGGFQEYLLIPDFALRANVVNKIQNPNLTFEEISFIEPLGCCINMQNQLNFKSKPNLLIIGGGRFGLLNALVAKINSAGKIFLMEPLEYRHQKAKDIGCDAVFTSFTHIPPVDIIIPCCSDPSAFDMALKILKKKGQLGYFSGIVQTDDTKIDINLIHYKEFSVIGSYGCSLKHCKEAASYLEQNLIDVNPLISHKISLADIKIGLNYVKNNDGFSTIIEM